MPPYDLVARWGNEPFASRIQAALEVAALCYDGNLSGLQLAWIVDQMVRRLGGLRYPFFVLSKLAGEDGPETYSWSIGVAPPVVACPACGGRLARVSQVTASDEAERLSPQRRVLAALSLARRFGGDGTQSHHIAWQVDQMVRRLASSRYPAFVGSVLSCPHERAVRTWSVGIPP